MDKQVKNRLKSLSWRLGGMIVIFILNGFLTMLTDGTIVVPVPYVIFAGLIVGEITKYFNSLNA